MRVRGCNWPQSQAHYSADDEKGPPDSADCYGLKTPACWILLRSDVLGRLLDTFVALATCRPNTQISGERSSHAAALVRCIWLVYGS